MHMRGLHVYTYTCRLNYRVSSSSQLYLVVVGELVNLAGLIYYSAVLHKHTQSCPHDTAQCCTVLEHLDRKNLQSMRCFGYA